MKHGFNRSKYLLSTVLGLVTLVVPIVYSWSRSARLDFALKALSSNPAGQSTAASTPLPVERLTQTRVSQMYYKLPLSFEANRGQTDSKAKFISRGEGYALFLNPTGLAITLRGPRAQNMHKKFLEEANNIEASSAERQRAVVGMTLVNGNSTPEAQGIAELAGKSNYFIGDDPSKWRTNIPQYAKVQFSSVYPGVDLVYYGNQRQLEYDLIIAPGTDPNVVTLRFEGADKLEVDAQGNLLLHVATGYIVQHKPIVYQETNGIRNNIFGAYVLKDNDQVGFEIDSYDVAKPLS